jgi:hypothetical protein
MQAPSVGTVTREATIMWQGHPPGGEPRLTVGSHALTPSPPLNVGLEVPHPLSTSPLELLAGAIGAVFARFLAEALVQEQTQARELAVRITLTLSSGADVAAPSGGDPPVSYDDLSVHAIHCDLSARVPGVEPSHLQALAERALKGSLEHLGIRADGMAVTVEAKIEGS